MIRATIAALAALMTASPALAQVATDQPPVVADAAKVRVDKISVRSAAIAGNLEGNPADREVLVVLPPAYDKQPTRRFPVVYALHGFWIDAPTWWGEIHMPQTAEGAFAKGAKDMILVFPSSKTRHMGSLYASGGTVGDFETFIAQELIAHIDANYRTLATPQSRGLVGHSMGGYGATRIGMKHGEKFGALYLMSAGGLSPRGPFTIKPEVAAQLEAIDSLDDLAALPNEARGPLAMAAAFSPNPAKPPLYLDFPFEGGKDRPEIIAKWTANAPLAFIDQYASKLRGYRAIAIDVGDKDWLIEDSKRLHAALGGLGITSTLDIYDGDHTNRLGFRMQDHVLPFFSQHLVGADAQ